MKIATCNVNSIRTRLDMVARWLERHRPDIVGLQETKVVDELFPAEAFRRLGYHASFRGQKSYNGVALLSRRAPDEVSGGFDDGLSPDEPRLLYARFGKRHIVNTYVPQGRAIDHPMFRYKVEWFGRLRNWFDRRFTTRSSLIWLGDMNVAHDPIDVHNPGQRARHVCYHEDARRAFAECRAWGFEDVFRRFHPEAGHYTFYDYRDPQAMEKGHGWRIDYILATPALARRAKDAWIDLEPRKEARPSDHTFLVAEFE